MDDKKIDSVSYLVYESSQTRTDRIIHRLIMALLISVILLFVSNAIWLYAWSQKQDSQTVQDSNYIGENGVIHNDGN
jgi:hypothetical protein